MAFFENPLTLKAVMLKKGESMNFIRRFFRCRHVRAHWVQGKTYCPDCGNGLVFQWVLLRCLGCRQPRPSVLQHGKVVPKTRCCIDCGEAKTSRELLPEPQYFQLPFVSLVLAEENPQTLEDFSPRTLHHWGIDIPLLLESGKFS